MFETSKQFLKKPRRPSDKARRVMVSPEAKLAYEEEMKAREERERNYTRHLPGPDNKAGR